jgi:glycosyltransferase involved in cell wall biosynthesis
MRPSATPVSNRDAERLVFVLPNVLGGGAARVAAVLCGEWVEAGRDVHLVTFEEPGSEPVYPLDERIVRHQIGLSVSPRSVAGFLANNAARVLRVRRLLLRLRPTAVVAFLLEANSTAVVAGLGLDVPILISERNHPAYDRITGFREILRRLVYPRAARLCVQTEDIRAWFSSHLGMESVCIPNPVPKTTFGTSKRGPEGRKTAVSLGRLEPQKGHDRLIEAFAMVADKAPDWDMVIYGEGSLRGSLEQQIARTGLGGRVFLPGETRSPASALHASDLYVHAARFEGAPNAVLEAMSEGLCVVAIDCPGAVSEILQGGGAGLLVPDGNNAALAKIMSEAMQDAQLRMEYGTRARNAARLYTPATIAALWLREVEELRAGRAWSQR